MDIRPGIHISIKTKNMYNKVKKLFHNSLNMAKYLEPNNLNITQSEAKTLFKLKSKMVLVKANHPRELKKKKQYILHTLLIRRKLNKTIIPNMKTLTRKKS